MYEFCSINNQSCCCWNDMSFKSAAGSPGPARLPRTAHDSEYWTLIWQVWLTSGPPAQLSLGELDSVRLVLSEARRDEAGGISAGGEARGRACSRNNAAETPVKALGRHMTEGRVTVLLLRESDDTSCPTTDGIHGQTRAQRIVRRAARSGQAGGRVRCLLARALNVDYAPEGPVT